MIQTCPKIRELGKYVVYLQCLFTLYTENIFKHSEKLLRLEVKGKKYKKFKDANDAVLLATESTEPKEITRKDKQSKSRMGIRDKCKKSENDDA